jgi:hypothetical protein
MEQKKIGKLTNKGILITSLIALFLEIIIQINRMEYQNIAILLAKEKKVLILVQMEIRR